MMRHIAVFDVGGTLIADPFASALTQLENDADFCALLASGKIRFGEMASHWKDENTSFDFEFASHFLQEEIWIRRALQRIAPALDSEVIAVFAPLILHRYRRAAFAAIRNQPQVPRLQKIMERLATERIGIVAASNDRQFATYSMLQVAGIAGYFSHVFTSEGMSEMGVHAEKPSPEFFETALRIAHIGDLPKKAIAYIGDSEPKDILPAKALGLTTVRVSALESAAFELSSNVPLTKTSADYAAGTLDALEDALLQWASKSF